MLGSSAEVVDARRAAARLAKTCEIGPKELAWALGQTTRSARRAMAAPVSPDALRAVRVRLALEELVGHASRRRAG